ncbi:unnamed protein product [Phaeothamnion confervicola]
MIAQPQFGCVEYLFRQMAVNAARIVEHMFLM